MTTIAVVPPSASPLHDPEEIKTSIWTIDQKDNETNKFSNWGADYEFCTLAWFLNVITLIDLTIIFCLFFLTGIQILASKNELGKNSVFLAQIQTTSIRCVMIAVFIALAQSICIFDPYGIIKLLREKCWWEWIFFLFICSVFGGLFYILSSLKSIQMLVEIIFEQKFSSSAVQNSASIRENSFSAKPNSVFYLENISIICNIQQIIVLIMLIRWKPKNFDWFKYHDKTKHFLPSVSYTNDPKQLSEPQHKIPSQSQKQQEIITQQ